MNDPIYPPCKKCGASHGMCIENMETVHIEPLDICKDCLWKDSIMPMNCHITIADLMQNGNQSLISNPIPFEDLE